MKSLMFAESTKTLRYGLSSRRSFIHCVPLEDDFNLDTLECADILLLVSRASSILVDRSISSTISHITFLNLDYIVSIEARNDRKLNHLLLCLTHAISITQLTIPIYHEFGGSRSTSALAMSLPDRL